MDRKVRKAAMRKLLALVILLPVTALQCHHSDSSRSQWAAEEPESLIITLEQDQAWEAGDRVVQVNYTKGSRYGNMAVAGKKNFNKVIDRAKIQALIGLLKRVYGAPSISSIATDLDVFRLRFKIGDAEYHVEWDSGSAGSVADLLNETRKSILKELNL